MKVVNQSRYGNKVKRVVQVYEEKFRMIPFFLRDFSDLFNNLDVKTLPSHSKIYDFENAANKFFVIKKGRVKIEKTRKGLNQSAQIKVEGEWFGYETLLHQASDSNKPQNTNRFESSQLKVYSERAITLEYCELVVGHVELLQEYLSSRDIAKLHKSFRVLRSE